MLVKYWKNFKWFLFIPLIVFIFVFKIDSVNAYVYKSSINVGMTQNTYSGNISSGYNSVINVPFTSNITNTTYDILVIKFGNFSLRTGNGSSVDSTSSFTCSYYQTAPSGDIACSSGGLTTYDNSTEGNIYIQGALYYSNMSGEFKSTCFFTSELKDMMVCPIVMKERPIVGFEFNIRNGGFGNLNYNVTFNALKYFFNYDSTEITIQQNTTNTNLQYIYQQQQQQQTYMENSTTTGATNQVQGDFSDLASSFNSELEGVNDLSQLVLMPISLFMDLSTDNCQPLHLQIPYVNMSVDLPCMKAVFNQYFNGLYSIFTTIMSAVICYWVAIKTGALVKEIVDCDNDRIEVVDL